MDKARAKRFAADLLGKSVGQWQITDTVDYGKSALVFKGMRDGVLGAVKVFDPEIIERFGEDAQATRIERQLSLRDKNHPNLIPILDGGKCPQTNLYFIVMTFVDGPKLSDVLLGIPRESIWAIINQIAQAAQFLETLELVHRDIKPDNIAISIDFKKAVLLDLGVVRPFGAASLTDDDHKVFVGTLQYSPPEFMLREENDTLEGWRSLTFYQLGAVLHDMIMRQRLFGEFAQPYPRLVEAIKYEFPKIVAPDVSPEIVGLALNCLLKDPVQRLKFVTWDSFRPRAQASINANQARERIRQRRAQGGPLREDKQDTDSEAQARNTRALVHKIRAWIEKDVREECIGSGFFPPMELHEAHDEHPSQADFVVCFCPSTDHELRRYLLILFSVKLLDQTALSIEIGAAAALHTTRLERDAFSSMALSIIFEGVAAEAVTKTPIHDYLYLILDKAQLADTPPPCAHGGDNKPQCILIEAPENRGTHDE